MNFNNYTIKSQQAVQKAVELVRRSGHQAIEPEHLLKGILVKDKDISNYLFQKMGANPSQIERIVDSEITHLPKVQGGDPYFSSATNTLLQRSLDYSTQMGDEFVSVEPILLAMVAIPSTASRILKDAGIT